MKPKRNNNQKKLMRDLTDVLFKYAKGCIKDLKSTSPGASVPKNLIDTKNLQESQVAIPKRPTLTKAEVIVSEAYYAPYIGSENNRANSYLKQHLQEKVKELDKNIKVTIDNHVKLTLNGKK